MHNSRYIRAHLRSQISPFVDRRVKRDRNSLNIELCTRAKSRRLFLLVKVQSAEYNILIVRKAGEEKNGESGDN